MSQTPASQSWVGNPGLEGLVGGSREQRGQSEQVKQVIAEYSREQLAQKSVTAWVTETRLTRHEGH